MRRGTLIVGIDGHFLRGFTVSRSETGTNAKTVLNPGEPVFGHFLVDTQAVCGVSYRYPGRPTSAS